MTSIENKRKFRFVSESSKSKEKLTFNRAKKSHANDNKHYNGRFEMMSLTNSLFLIDPDQLLQLFKSNFN